MPAQTSRTPFILRPQPDLLDRHPYLRHAAGDLARKYAFHELVTDDELQAMGQRLWTALTADDPDLAAAFTAARQQAGATILPIIVESDQAAVQLLPWETLHHPDHAFLGQSPAFTLHRRVTAAPPDPPPLDPGPLRVLLFTALPDDLDAETGRLSVEEQQAQVLEALSPLIAAGQVQLEMPDDGRFTTLQRLLADFRPQLLFLFGHGKFYDQPLSDEVPYAVFQFEADDGSSDLVRDEAIAAAFYGSGVSGVVLSACESGKGSSTVLTNGLVWQLSHIGIPHVIGMRESILERAGILFNRTLCAAIAGRERIDAALQQARRAITTPLANQSLWLHSGSAGLSEVSLGQWCLPMLVSTAAERPLIDWDFTPQPPQQRLTSETLRNISLPPRFVGRRTELRDLKSRLRQGQLHQLLITGPGGQGKTALAGRLAQDLARRGHLVLAWSAGETGSDWKAFLFDAEYQLSVDSAARYSQMAARYETETDRARLLLRLLLRERSAPVVLFFDNLEALQDPRTLALTDDRVGGWIAAARELAGPQLILLLTSRWQLPGWPDADHWPLQPASYGDFLQMVLQQPLPPTFVRDHNRLRRVYAALHGNGRGLRFFAAALQGLGKVEEEAFLQKLAAATAELQTNMALDLIANHLTEPETALLDRLRAYQTPVPAEGLVKLGLDLPDPEALWRRLLAVSLLERQWQPRWQVAEYRLPQPVVGWLVQRLGTPVAPAHYQAAANYLDYLYRQERRTLDQAIVLHQAWLAARETEHAHRLALDNIVGPLNRAGLYHTLLTEWLPSICESAEWRTRAEALGQTGKQHLHTGNYDSALGFLQQSLAIQQEIGDKAGMSATLNNISQIHHGRGDYDTALDFLQQSHVISQEVGTIAGMATSLNNISQIYKARSDYDTALDFLQQSLAIRQKISDKAGIAQSLNNISQIYKARGDYDTALDFLQQSLAISQKIGDKAGIGTTLSNVATTAHARGDYDTALDFLQQSLVIRQEIGDKAGIAQSLNNISQIYKARGDYDTALDFLQQSFAISQEIGNKVGMGAILNNISQIYEARSDYDTALNFLQQSLAISQEIGDKAGMAISLSNMATTAHVRGDHDSALNFLQQSLAISQEIGDKAGMATSLSNMATTAHVRGDHDSALNFLQQSLAIDQEIGDKAGMGTTLNNMATTAYARGDYDTALDFLQQSLAIRQEIGDTAGLCTTLFNMGHMHWQNGAQQEAVDAWVAAYVLANRIGYAQALDALAKLGQQLGLGGMDGWAALAAQLPDE